jgi:hypothetical protein
MLEALEPLDLGAQPDGAERVDPAQAPEPGDRLSPRRERRQLGDRGLELIATDDQRVDRAEVVKQRRLRAGLGQA